MTRLFGGERSVSSALLGFGRYMPLGFRHDKEVKCKTDSGYPGKREERCTVSSVNDDEPGECGGQGRAYALCGKHRPLRDVKPARAAHQIGDDYRKNRTVYARTDPIQQLHADQPISSPG
jgi:hypothetical protein